LLDAICDVDHRHVDLLQVHRTDTLFFEDDDGSALLVKLDGRDERSLLSVFRRGVIVAGKTGKYRVGYLYKYDYFDLLKTRRDTRLFVKDLNTYVAEYVCRRFQLRIEEVVTLDYRRLSCSMSQAFECYRVFEEGETAIATRELLQRGLVYRMYDWDRHVRSNIWLDLRLLRSVTGDRFPGSLPYTPKSLVMRVMRAEFRAMYFVHGRSTTYNFTMCEYMFENGSEVAAIEDSEIVRVRSLDQDDDDDDTFVPLYARDLAVPVVKAMCLLWSVANSVPTKANTRTTTTTSSARCGIS